MLNIYFLQSRENLRIINQYSDQTGNIKGFFIFFQGKGGKKMMKGVCSESVHCIGRDYTNTSFDRLYGGLQLPTIGTPRVHLHVYHPHPIVIGGGGATASRGRDSQGSGGRRRVGRPAAPSPAIASDNITINFRQQAGKHYALSGVGYASLPTF